MPAREFDEGVAVPAWPAGKGRAGDHLVQLDRRRHVGDRKGGKIDAARSIAARNRDLGVERRRERDQLRRWIEMTERTAERAAITRLPMSDLAHRLVHERATLAHDIGELDVALARHGADLERAVLLADVAQTVDPIDVDDVVRQHVTHVEHGHERLPAGKQLGVLEAAEETDGIRNRARIMIRKGRWFHAGLTVCGLLTLYRKLCISSKTYINPNFDTSGADLTFAPYLAAKS